MSASTPEVEHVERLERECAELRADLNLLASKYAAAFTGREEARVRLAALEMSILGEAHEVLTGSRQATYGDPVETARRIGEAWGAILGDGPIPAREVSLMMAVLKAVREAVTPAYHRDNMVDGAGYFHIAAEAAERAGGHLVALGDDDDREVADALAGHPGRPLTPEERRAASWLTGESLASREEWGAFGEVPDA